jgi:hypothetical protein
LSKKLLLLVLTEPVSGSKLVEQQQHLLLHESKQERRVTWHSHARLRLQAKLS